MDGRLATPTRDRPDHMWVVMCSLDKPPDGVAVIQDESRPSSTHTQYETCKYTHTHTHTLHHDNTRPHMCQGRVEAEQCAMCAVNLPQTLRHATHTHTRTLGCSQCPALRQVHTGLQPPSGPPYGTCASFRKLIWPSPPLPEEMAIRTLSTNRVLSIFSMTFRAILDIRHQTDHNDLHGLKHAG